MHAGAPDVATRLASQSVINGADQDLGTEGEQEVEDTVAQIVELPAGLAEEAVKRAVVFVLAELGGLDDAGEGAAAGAQDPGTAQAPKGVEAGLGKAVRHTFRSAKRRMPFSTSALSSSGMGICRTRRLP